MRAVSTVPLVYFEVSPEMPIFCCHILLLNNLNDLGQETWASGWLHGTYTYSTATHGFAQVCRYLTVNNSRTYFSKSKISFCSKDPLSVAQVSGVSGSYGERLIDLLDPYHPSVLCQRPPDRISWCSSAAQFHRLYDRPSLLLLVLSNKHQSATRFLCIAQRDASTEDAVRRLMATYTYYPSCISIHLASSRCSQARSSLNLEKYVLPKC